jgi:hypothetical protein
MDTILFGWALSGGHVDVTFSTQTAARREGNRLMAAGAIDGFELIDDRTGNVVERHGAPRPTRRRSCA